MVEMCADRGGTLDLDVLIFSSKTCLKPPAWLLRSVHTVTLLSRSGCSSSPLCLFQFDTNGDGEITLAELQQAMQRLLGERLTPREISEFVQEADVNGDGTVDFEGDVRGWACRDPFPAPDVVFQVGHAHLLSRCGPLLLGFGLSIPSGSDQVILKGPMSVTPEALWSPFPTMLRICCHLSCPSLDP